MTALMLRLAELALSVAARVLNWLFGPPRPPGTRCPDFVPGWVLHEHSDLLPKGWAR